MFYFLHSQCLSLFITISSYYLSSVPIVLNNWKKEDFSLKYVIKDFNKIDLVNFLVKYWRYKKRIWFNIDGNDKVTVNEYEKKEKKETDGNNIIEIIKGMIGN